LSEDFGGGDHLGAISHFNAGWNYVPGSGLTAGLPWVLIQKILKLYFVFLVPCGINVGYVIGNDIQVELLGLHARGSGI
jgi:hypothetical protein